MRGRRRVGVEADDRLVIRLPSPMVTTVEYEGVGASSPGRQRCRPAAGHVGIRDHPPWSCSEQLDWNHGDAV